MKRTQAVCASITRAQCILGVKVPTSSGAFFRSASTLIIESPCFKPRRNANAFHPRSLFVRAFASASSPSGLLRTNIGIFGSMNAGKSTLMNLLTQHETSIVDSKPGTTADVKISLMEIHKIGPVKLFDTPGVNEEGELGEKKRRKAFDALKECDVAIVVIDPSQEVSINSACKVISELNARKKAAGDAGSNAKLLIVYNIFASNYDASKTNSILEAVERRLPIEGTEVLNCVLDLTSPEAGKRLQHFIASNVRPHISQVPVLPPMDNLDPNAIVLLNIPMDAETPSGRLLRPQAMVQEELLRRYVSTVAYRMDLKKARSKDESERKEEEKRWRSTVDALRTNGRLKLVITDSQAMDICHKWTLEPSSDQSKLVPTVPLTTFSVIMINYLSGGKLSKFVEGLKKFDQLGKGSKVLICEACNHDRIQDDIGTVQIPTKLKQHFGEGTIHMEHAFGREYQTKILSNYDLVIHCGGCMLDQQKMSARLSDIEETGVPVTNYGLLLSKLVSGQALMRVVEPWAKTAKDFEKEAITA